MKLIKPEVKEVVFHIPEGYTVEQWIEKAGRTCYKSEDKITENSAPRFIRMLRKRGHHAMLEHAIISAVIIGDRGLTHELVRHRLASFAQESTRYCNYSKGKFHAEITVIDYPWKKKTSANKYRQGIEAIERLYMELLEDGEPPELARAVLPISLKAEIVITANLREWSHIFNMRCDTPAHPIIKGTALEVLKTLNNRLPSMYEDQSERFLTH
jgi:thymidylate synthase (FAD)